MTLEKGIEKAKRKESRKRETKKIAYKDCEFYWYAMPIAVPVYHLAQIMNKYNNWKYNSMVWDERKANKVIEAVLSKMGNYHDNAIWYHTGWWDTIWWNKSPRRYREWADKHKHNLKKYIVEEYEPAGFEKIIKDDCYSVGEKWVGFKKI